MGREPDNLVLQMLRDIRGVLADQKLVLEAHSRHHAEHRAALAELRDEMHRANENAVFAAGLGALSQRDVEAVRERLAALETRVGRVETRLDKN